VKLQKPNEQITFEITIAKGIVKTVRYNVNSDIDSVTMSFCKENGLPGSIREKLKAEICKSLSAFLEAHKNV
jgi:hypothetical protein